MKSHNATISNVPVVQLACFRTPRTSSSSRPSHKPGFSPASASSAPFSVPEALASESVPRHACSPASPKHLHKHVNSVHADCVSQDTVQDNVHSSYRNLRCVRRPRKKGPLLTIFALCLPQHMSCFSGRITNARVGGARSLQLRIAPCCPPVMHRRSRDAGISVNLEARPV